jgi:hypothetical protein
MRLSTATALVILAAACGPAPAPGDSDAAPPDRIADDGAPAAGGASGTDAGWTLQPTRVQRAVEGAGVLQAMRAARHDTFDRIVLDFGTGPLPGYWIEYLRPPVTQCGSGDTVRIAGRAWLKVQVTPAHAHTEEGRPTVVERSLTPALPGLVELRLICDYEGYVDVVAGVEAAEPYRVMELADPARLVVDVRHPRRGAIR